MSDQEKIDIQTPAPGVEGRVEEQLQTGRGDTHDEQERDEPTLPVHFEHIPYVSWEPDIGEGVSFVDGRGNRNFGYLERRFEGRGRNKGRVFVECSVRRWDPDLNRFEQSLVRTSLESLRPCNGMADCKKRGTYVERYPRKG